MSLLEMSVTGGIMVLAVTVLRAVLLNRLPKKTFVFLWEMTVLRLLLPISVPFVLSIYTLFNRTEMPVQGNTVVTDAPIIANALTEGSYQAATKPLQENITSGISISPWTIVWLAGMIAVLAAFMAGYVMVFRKYRYAVLVKNGYPAEWLSEQRIKRKVRICLSSETVTPLTYGIFHPVILLPEGIDTRKSQRLNYILTHEMTHIRRFDMVRKAVAALVLSIHWFNPLVWVLFALYNRDIELACDEAVVRKTGGDCRSDYAMTLIGMEEEQRNISLFSHFSKNAAEERIEAIMKVKKITAITAAAACAAVLGVTGVFATSAASAVAAPEGEVTLADKIFISNGETGEAFYSLDGGKTFLKQKDIDINLPDVEWWTYEEYKAWLEEEKVALQEMLGEKGWTGGRGDFVWTQEIIDETITMYEGILEQIKNGVKVSKSVDGENDVMLMQADPVTSVSEIQGDSLDNWGGVSQEELLEKFGAFGISFDKDGNILYNGEKVRYFCDGCEVGDGGRATKYSNFNADGAIDVYTVYEPVPNGDGSVDPFGKLTGLRKASQEEFDKLHFGFNAAADEFSQIFSSATAFDKDKNFVEGVFINEYNAEATEAYAEGNAVLEGTSFENIFAKYKKYGLEYKAAAAGLGNVYYNGELVKHFSDVSPKGSAFSFESSDGGEITVTAVYDENGDLIGVKKAS